MADQGRAAFTQSQLNAKQIGDLSDSTQKTFKKVLNKNPIKRQIPISNPSGWTWDAHPLKNKIFFNTENYEFTTTLDLSDYENVATGQTYYVRKEGSDTNDGLTWETAFKTVWKAIQMTDRKRIYVGAGIYNRNEGLQGVGITKPVEIIGIGDVRFGQYDNLTWTLSSGQTKTYETTRTNVNRIFDSKTVDTNGDYLELNKKASIAEVEANPNSWYTDGTKVYVHTATDVKPDATIFVYMNITGFAATNTTCYLENIQFEGGSWAVKMNSDVLGVPAKLYAKNITAKYAGAGNGYEILGSDTVFVNCIAAKNLDDGFNYHSSSVGNICRAIEIGCIGRDNGQSSDTDNGSTMHDGGKIIRINGEYMRNKGPNVADVTVGTETWNMDCVAYDSTSANSQKTDFQASDPAGGAVKAWYENCRNTNSKSLYSLGIMDANSTVKLRGCNLPLSIGSGVRNSY